MKRRYTSFVLIAGLLAASRLAQAQPNECTQRDQEVVAQYLPHMIDAAMNDNQLRLVALFNDMQPRISRPCLAQILRNMAQQQGRSTGRPRPGGSIEQGSDGTLYGPGVACPPTGGCVMY